MKVRQGRQVVGNGIGRGDRDVTGGVVVGRRQLKRLLKRS